MLFFNYQFSKGPLKLTCADAWNRKRLVLTSVRAIYPTFDDFLFCCYETHCQMITVVWDYFLSLKYVWFVLKRFRKKEQFLKIRYKLIHKQFCGLSVNHLFESKSCFKWNRKSKVGANYIKKWGWVIKVENFKADKHFGH